MSGKAGFGTNPQYDGDPQPSTSDTTQTNTAEPTHGFAITEGLRGALSWVTVFPVRGPKVFDRITGRRAMLALPIAGLCIGIASLCLIWLPQRLELVVFTAALLIVCNQLLTRLMHLDGLADVGDALGSYASPERAQEILADKYTGALGMGGVVLVLLMQFAAYTTLIQHGTLIPITAALLAVPVFARIAALLACASPFRPQKEGGFGGLVIGTVKIWEILVWAVVAVVSFAAFAALPHTLTFLRMQASAEDFTYYMAITPAELGFPAQLALFAVPMVVTLLGATVFVRHCNKRFAGLNGDCIGATIEISATIAASTMAVVFVIAAMFVV